MAVVAWKDDISRAGCNMSPSSVKNLKVTTTISASILKWTPQNSRVREVNYTDCGTNAILSGWKNDGPILVKTKRHERGNKEKEERGSYWAAGLVGTDIII